MKKKIKYKKKNIFPYGEVLIPENPPNEAMFRSDWKIRKEERGWLTKAIIEKLSKRKQEKRKKHIELLKLDIEIAELEKKLNKIKGGKNE